MSRKLMAMLVSSALVFGGVSTSALSATDTAGANQTQNSSPLPPGGAAGIKEAQGIENSPWLGLGIVAGIVIIAWVLLDDDDDEDEGPSTGTN